VQTSDNRTQSVYLSDHVRVDTSNQLDTDKDRKQAYSESQPVILTTEVHTERSWLSYVCEFCDRICASASKFKTRMHIQTGERPFSCSVCDKKRKRVLQQNDFLAMKYICTRYSLVELN